MPRLIEAGGGKRLIEAGGGKREPGRRLIEAGGGRRITAEEAEVEYATAREENEAVPITPAPVEAIDEVAEEGEATAPESADTADVDFAEAIESGAADQNEAVEKDEE
jgi:hypothetical protein